MEDTNLVSLIERFGSEEKCRTYLEELRWPDGPECPRCGDFTTISRITTRDQFECDACRYQFSVTAGTLIHDSHLPLWKWFLAVYLMCESKKGISAKQLQRMLKVSYKTAWYLSHRIRDAMGDGEQPLLTGTVEVDETYVGGHRKGYGKGYRGNKVVIAGAIERGGEIRLRLVPNARRHNLEGFITSSVDVDGDTAIYTDELASYDGITGNHHETVTHKDEEWVRGNVHTNTVESAWSLLKRSVVGTYHHMSVKHLPAYLDEMEWRFNNRENPYLFRDTLLILLHGDALPYQVLIERDDPGERQRENDALMRREAKRQARRSH
jgi:transposase-like protein